MKGLQVAPAELQLALVTHPNIEDAAVVGCRMQVNTVPLNLIWSLISHRQEQEHPRAFVVRKLGEELSEIEVFNFIKTRFARHKWLTGGVFFIDAIPRTPSGKVKKRELPNIPQGRPLKL